MADSTARQHRRRRGRGHPREENAPLAFWAHQFAEYLVAVLLGLTAAHLRANLAKPLLAAAGAMVLLALLSDGPLGGWRLISQRTHHVLDLGLVVALAAAPIAARSNDIVVVLMFEGLALTMAMLVRRSSYAPQRRPHRANLQPISFEQSGRGSNPARIAGFALSRARRDGPYALGRMVGRRAKP